MTVEAGFGLFALGMIVTVVFFYFLLKFMEITNKENMKEEEREKYPWE
jgi:dipeptide/tripeptide permease